MTELTALRGQEAHSVPLVEPGHFLAAQREIGYASVAAAVAELVDNSLESISTQVAVVVRQATQPEVAVVDNGSGIERRALSKALQFGGSSRFDSREGAGRFGMGLPAASFAFARRVDVFSRIAGRRWYRATLDFDAIALGSTSGIPAAAPGAPPSWVPRLPSRSGTSVVWSNCDRMVHRSQRALLGHLATELGRIFRRPLTAGVSITLNGRRITPIDPLLVSPSPTGAAAEVLPEICFELRASRDAQCGQVRVRFSRLPIEQWAALPAPMKREYGISGRAGTSVLRAGREIAYGWMLFGGKRRENYDDWWRCEISFEPVLDEQFGVTNSKQGIRPSQELVDALVPTLEAQARILNREVRERFARLRSSTAKATSKAASLHPRLASRAGTSTRLNGRVEGRTEYRLEFGADSDREFIKTVRREETIIVRLNTLHPFYLSLYSLVEQEGSAKLTLKFKLLLLALARAHLSVVESAHNESPAEVLRLWSDNIALFLEGER